MAYANRVDRTRHNGPRKGGPGERLAEEAIALAASGRWAEAARANRELLKTHPRDTRTLNRLGKCLVELGEFESAALVYGRTLHFDRQNEIARKNLERLAVLAAPPATVAAPGATIDPQALALDPGRAAGETQRDTAPGARLASAPPGAALEWNAEVDDLEEEEEEDDLDGEDTPVARTTAPTEAEYPEPDIDSGADEKDPFDAESPGVTE